MSLMKRMLLALIAGQLALVLTSVASADESIETATLTLLPGDNFVGWVAEPIAVEDIFEAIPAASLIYRWDADTRHWLYAIRKVGGNLGTLEPGIAATIRIEGRKSVKWERPLTPAKGMVTLYQGVNWVAWNGRDEWPLDQVARGIGKSLVSIEVQGEVHGPDVDANVARIRRGDALRVTVSRDVRWLQPTGMMPTIEWVGDISQVLRDEITEDIRRILDFFADRFAVESDFSDTTILVWNGVDAAVEYAESGAEPQFGYSPQTLRVRLTSGRTAQTNTWGFFFTACGWPPSPPICGARRLETLTHEWFHHVQGQVSDQQDLLVSPIWMIEGSAVWAEWQLSSRLTNDPDALMLDQTLEAVAGMRASLESVEQPYTQLAYSLGSAAAERLAEVSDADAHIEYFRQLYPQAIDNERRWVRTSTWQAAFENAFGLTAPEFYRRFAAWRDTLPTPAPQYNYNLNDVNLTGTLRYSDGTPASGFRIEASEHLDGTNVDHARTAIVDDAGSFSMEVTPQTTQRIQITRDACRLWLTDDGLKTSYPELERHRDLDTRNPTELNLKLPEGACENELRIDVIRLRDDERQVQVFLIEEESHDSTPARLGPSGTYIGYAPTPGRYRVRLRLDGCGVFWSEDGIVASSEAGDVLHLSDEPITIDVRIPSKLCVLRIVGHIRYENGTAASGIGIYVGDGGVYSSTTTDAMGQFDVAVGDSGNYMLSIDTDVAGCRIRYSESGATTDWGEVSWITVADDDVIGIEFVVPNDPSSLCR